MLYLKFFSYIIMTEKKNLASDQTTISDHTSSSNPL
jgi:hypothetical protein